MKDTDKEKKISCEKCNKTIAKGYVIKGSVTIKCKNCKHCTTVGK